MTDTLSPEAVDAAIEYVAARWPNHPFSAAQREAWADVLVYLRPGELKGSLATLAGNFRPDPDKVLAAAQGLRPKPLPPNDWSLPHPDGPAPESNREMNLRRLNELLQANPGIPSKSRKEAGK